MNGHDVRESWGQPRRIAHTYEIQTMNLWYVGGLIYLVVTSIIGHVLIIKELWNKF